MKKNLPFSLIGSHTFFAGLSCNTAYQSHSFHCKNHCINNNAKKQPAGTHKNFMANKSMNGKSCELIISLRIPGDQYKEGYKISDEIWAKETRDVDIITCGYTHKFFNNLIIYKQKKAGDIRINQVGWPGIVLDRPGFEFTKFSGKKLAKSHTISVSQKTEG